MLSRPTSAGLGSSRWVDCACSHCRALFAVLLLQTEQQQHAAVDFVAVHALLTSSKCAGLNLKQVLQVSTNSYALEHPLLSPKSRYLATKRACAFSAVVLQIVSSL